MSRLRSSWRTDITLVDSPGRDRDGRQRAGAERLVKRAIVVPVSSEEQGNLSEASLVQARLFLPPDVSLPSSTCRVKVPVGHPLAGTWQGEGDALPYPKGTVLNLRRLR